MAGSSTGTTQPSRARSGVAAVIPGLSRTPRAEVDADGRAPLATNRRTRGFGGARGTRAIQRTATAIVPMPPRSTAGTVPTRAATRPDSNAPSWLDVPVKSECTALTRPSIVMGVRIWTSDERMTTLTTSAAPRTPSARKESAKLDEMPNATVATPNTKTARNKVRPMRH